MVATRLLQNGLFTLRNRPILMNLSRGIQTPTPLYWSKHISTDLRDSRGWSIWFEKNGIPEKNGKITSLIITSTLDNHLRSHFCYHVTILLRVPCHKPHFWYQSQTPLLLPCHNLTSGTMSVTIPLMLPCHNPTSTTMHNVNSNTILQPHTSQQH